MTFLKEFLIYAVVIIAVAAGKTDKKDAKPPVYHSAQIKVGNNHAQAISSGNGVASASVASRNGRVSSYSSAYSHPGLGAPIMVSTNDVSGVLAGTKKGDGKTTSMTITKEIDDKYTKGTIKISPGSVSVTSVAKAGAGVAPGFDAFKFQQPAPFVPFTPFIHDPFFPHPIHMLQPRFDPWFPREMFKNTHQTNTKNVRPSWYNPTFNPYFSYWH